MSQDLKEREMGISNRAQVEGTASAKARRLELASTI